jgi:small conductance mechanosensitive channel
MNEDFTNSFKAFGDSIIKNFPSILIGFLLLVIFVFLAIGARSLTRKRLVRRVEDELLVNFVARSIFLLIVVVGIVIFLNQIGLGKAAGGLLAGAGVSALVLGFAFKDIGENFIAGFFLAFSRPFSVGDTIEVEGLKGIVKALNFRNTHIRSVDGKDIFLPNALLIKNPLLNYTRDGLLRYDFLIGLDYGDDIREVGRLINKILAAEPKIEHEGELAPFMLINEFSTSTINIKVFYWVNNVQNQQNIAHLKTEVMNNVVLGLVQGGFHLPADIVELKIYQEGQPIPVNVKIDK